MPDQSANRDVEIDCVFRTGVETFESVERAQCLLLSQLLSVAPQSCVFPRTVCEACSRHSQVFSLNRHPILPSLILEIANNESEKASEVVDRQRWEHWRQTAEAAIVSQTCESQPTLGGVISCDVLIDGNDPGGHPIQQIDFVMEQADAVSILHYMGPKGNPLPEKLSDRWNVRTHLSQSSQPNWQTLITELMTDHVAWIGMTEGKTHNWLSSALRSLRSEGAEIHVESEDPANSSLSLVIRRSTWADMLDELPAECHSLPDLVNLAIRQGRVFTKDSVWSETPAEKPVPSNQEFSPLRQYVHSRVLCDVIVPFHGQLHFVHEAIESLLHQDNAEAIIHLIDDASPEDTTAFLNDWSRHPQLRVYRNRENIGQFQSFNNVIPCCETDLVFVQDSDDISLPHRLAWTAELFHRTGADYFGAAVELFGDDVLIRPTLVVGDELKTIPRASRRGSFYPRWETAGYFVENPTAAFRVAMFRELGGYADFGNRQQNRACLDTEFQLRCLYRGVRFAISQRVVTRYRVHTQSATQNRETGWGTLARTAANQQLSDRLRYYRQGDFDARSFGSLGRYTHLTERWTPHR